MKYRTLFLMGLVALAACDGSDSSTDQTSDAAISGQSSTFAQPATPSPAVAQTSTPLVAPVVVATSVPAHRPLLQNRSK